MQIIERKLDCALLAARIINDERGWFQVAFSIEEIQELGLEFNSVFQLNHSRTFVKGIVRGPNYQKRPFNQSKIVRVIKGAVYSVGIDIDPKSNTFGKAAGFYLSEENQMSMYIPNTFAHGFTVLQDGTELEYLTDNRYNYDSAKSIWYTDNQIIDIDTGKQLDWTYGGAVHLSPIKSEKNATAPNLKDAEF